MTGRPVRPPRTFAQRLPYHAVFIVVTVLAALGLSRWRRPTCPFGEFLAGGCGSDTSTLQAFVLWVAALATGFGAAYVAGQVGAWFTVRRLSRRQNDAP